MKYLMVNYPASMDCLENLMNVISSWLVENGINQDGVYRVQLAVEEAVVNVIRHAYKESKGEVELRAKLEDDDRVIIEIIDMGVPFDVCSLPDPDLSCKKISERKTGGLGVLLMRRMAESLSYRRKGNKNILTLTLNLRKKCNFRSDDIFAEV
ncbi:MAG: ATP-binding protein [Syntrophales bacterium]|nr:ATP-binding protein [Syntrophales bacterium]